MGSHMTRLRPEVICELENATGYSEAKIKEFYVQFMHDYPQGIIRLSQFEDFYHQYLSNTYTLPFTLHVMYCANEEIAADQTVTFKEFLEAIAVTSISDARKRLEWAFDCMDYDQEGYISKDQVTHIVKGIYKLAVADDKEHLKTTDQAVKEIFKEKTLNYINKEIFIRNIFESSQLICLLQRDQNKLSESDDKSRGKDNAGFDRLETINETQETSFNGCDGAVGGAPADYDDLRREPGSLTSDNIENTLVVDSKMCARANQHYARMYGVQGGKV